MAEDELGDGAEVDWRSVLFDQDGRCLASIEGCARRRFPGQESLQQEAVNEALAHLTDADYARLRQGFKGRSAPATYLIAAARNRIEDFARMRFGRLVVPRPIRRFGGLALEIFRKLCGERQDETRVIDALVDDGQSTRQEVLATIRTVRTLVPDCGRSMREVPFPETGVVESVAGESPVNEPESPELAAEAVEREGVMSMLRLLLGDSSPPVGDSAAVSPTAPDLSDQDAALLRLRYQQTLNYAQIQQILGLSEWEVRSRLKALEQRLRQWLEGLGWDDRNAMPSR